MPTGCDKINTILKLRYLLGLDKVVLLVCCYHKPSFRYSYLLLFISVMEILILLFRF
jgi:hypothetical protein